MTAILATAYIFYILSKNSTLFVKRYLENSVMAHQHCQGKKEISYKFQNTLEGGFYTTTNRVGLL